MNIHHLNPDVLYKDPVFSQGVVVDGSAKMIYVGGQNGITADGSMAGDDFSSQSEQAYKNVIEVLQVAGASQENVVKLTIYVVQGQDINAGFAAAQKVWGTHPTAMSVLIVAGLAHPEALLEIDAVAAVEA